ALSDPAAVTPTFVPDKKGSYVAELIVNDGALDSAADTVTVTTENTAPVAKPTVALPVKVDDVVRLDGSHSSDAHGDVLTFAWALAVMPPGSAAVLSSPSALGPTFTADQPGVYVAQLIVNDGTVDSAPKSVRIETENSPPVADAGADQTVPISSTVHVD